MKASALITKAWLQLSSNNPLYNDQWISDETWLRLIKKHYSAFLDAWRNAPRSLGAIAVREHSVTMTLWRIIVKTLFIVLVAGRCQNYEFDKR